MSRIGRLPIPVPAGVDVTHRRPGRHGQGPEGHADAHGRRADHASSRDEDGTIAGDASQRRAQDPCAARADPHAGRQHGRGVTKGYTKTLEIVGVGYRVQAKGPRPGVRAGLQPPGHRRRRRRASPSASRSRPCSSSTASTSRRSARSPPTSASCASPTRTRARACGTRAKQSAARSERLVSRHGIRRGVAKQHGCPQRSRGAPPHAASARRSPARPERPRLVVTRSTRHIVVQIVDDLDGHTLASRVHPGGLAAQRARATRATKAAAGRRARRRACQGRRDHRGRLRPRRQPVPRPHRRAGGRRPRRRAGVLMPARQSQTDTATEMRNH